MKVKGVLQPLALGVTVAVSGMTLPTVASADMSASVAVSNMYLFRGINFSTGAGSVSGSLDYSHDSGLYAGAWVSNESSGSYELDLYAGFAGEAGGLSYDVGLIAYEFPESTKEIEIGGETFDIKDDESYGDVSELMISLGFGGASFTIYDSLQGESSGGAYTYYALGYEMGSFGVVYGGLSADAEDAIEYAHLDFSFAATDELSFTISTIIDDDDVETLETDPLISVMWGKSFDL